MAQDMFEGVGDATQLNNVYNTLYRTVYTTFHMHIPEMYSLVTREKKVVAFTVPDIFSREDHAPLTVRAFMGTPDARLLNEGDMLPGYDDKSNTLTLLIAPWLYRAKWPFVGNPPSPMPIGKPKFIEVMEKAMSYEIKYTFEQPSVARMLAHEMVHYFDSETKPGMMRRDGARTDRFERSREARESASPMAKYVEMLRDRLFPAVYAKGNYNDEDMKYLRSVRQSFGEAETNIYMNRKADPEKFKELERKSNLYRQQAYFNSIPEIRARVAEQLPWLLSQRKSNSDRMDPVATARTMVGFIFGIPSDGTYAPPPFKNLEEYQAHHRRKILPGAGMSVAKRLIKLIMAANELDVEKYRTVPERLGGMIYILSRDTQVRPGKK